MKNTEQYIKEAIKVHGLAYDYSKLIYTKSKDKVCIVCHKKDKNGIEHGEFWQEANSHLKGCGCPRCAKEKNGSKTKLSFEKFFNKCVELYGNTYAYDKESFSDVHTKMKISCPIHGEFWQSPRMHLLGKGCPKCSRNNNFYSAEKFIEKAKMIHGGKYNYSKSIYINARTKTCIICPKHGEFWQTPTMHLSGQGCPTCAKIKRRWKLEKFIENVIKVHGDKYDYSKVKYINSRTRVCIICPKHGEFWMKPNDHLNGQGCPKCGNLLKGKSIKLSKDIVLKRFYKIYNEDYSYKNWIDEYKNIECKIPIICKKHGLFYKTIHQHLQGQGCPKCCASTLENSVRMFLNENNFEIEEQKTFDWLKYNGLMKLDFYLPQHNIAIECQGEQHYKPFNIFGGENGLIKQKIRDELKKKLCEEHNIKVLYYGLRKYADNVITNKKELLKEIKNECECNRKL